MKKSFLIFFEWREREIQKYVVLVFRRLYLTFGINILYIWHNIDMTCLERLFSEIHINDFIYDFKIRSFVMFRKFLIYSDCNISQKLYVCTSVCVCVCAYTYVPIRVCPCVCVRTCVFLYETILVCSYTSTASTPPTPKHPQHPPKKVIPSPWNENIERLRTMIALETGVYGRALSPFARRPDLPYRGPAPFTAPALPVALGNCRCENELSLPLMRLFILLLLLLTLLLWSIYIYYYHQ